MRTQPGLCGSSQPNINGKRNQLFSSCTPPERSSWNHLNQKQSQFPLCIIGIPTLRLSACPRSAWIDLWSGTQQHKYAAHRLFDLEPVKVSDEPVKNNISLIIHFGVKLLSSWFENLSFSFHYFSFEKLKRSFTETPIKCWRNTNGETRRQQLFLPYTSALY